MIRENTKRIRHNKKNMTMNTIFNKNCLLAALLLAATGVITGCGDDDPVPAPNQTQTENNPNTNTNPGDNPNPTQPQTPEVEEIVPSAIEENAEEGTVSLRMAEQPGGRAVLTATAMETKAASQITIVGTYDSETGCYTFDLSVLDGGVTYQYVISVYDKDGKKVMESKQKTITLPESAEIDDDGSDGGSDGTRGGMNHVAETF